MCFFGHCSCPLNQCAFEIAEYVGLVWSKCFILIVKSSAQLTEVKRTLYQKADNIGVLKKQWKISSFCCSASLHLLHCTLKESEAFCKPFLVHLLNHVWCDLLRIWDKSIISSLCFQLPAAFSPFPHGPTGILSEKKHFFPLFLSKCTYTPHTVKAYRVLFLFFSNRA